MAGPARLAAGLWVSAYLARLSAQAIPAYITARGDDTAGDIVVKCARLDGSAQAWQRRYDLARDGYCWQILHDGPEPEVDAALARALARDRDLWLIEMESRAGETLLDDPGLTG